MRKAVMFLSLAFVLACATGVRAENQPSISDKLVLYIPNRIVDCVDMFSVGLGFGPVLKVEVRATRAIAFGGGVGASTKMVKAINRQYGFGLESGWDLTFLMIGIEDRELTDTTRLLKKYYQDYSGIALPGERIYDFYQGQRDYWEIGLDLAALVELNVALHPVEIADFITGFFFIDLKGDDYTKLDMADGFEENE
jgi:hypothetical protein